MIWVMICKIWLTHRQTDIEKETQLLNSYNINSASQLS